MPVSIGIPANVFTNPIGLLSDCHRRIDRFLQTLQIVTAEKRGRPLGAEYRQALQTALHYFRNTAPNHTADEEEDLFPALRGMERADAPEVWSRIDRLEADHCKAEQWHRECDQIGNRWLRDDILCLRDAAKLRIVLSSLTKLYRAHIEIEENHVFPWAQRVLSDGDKAAIRTINGHASWNSLRVMRLTPAMSEQSRATAILTHEHLAVKSVVQAMLKIADAVEQYQFVDQALLTDVTSFLEAFARQCQQAQEEAILFPLLAAKCVTPFACFIAGLAEEHSRAQSLASELVENVSRYVLGGGARHERLVTSLRDLAALYRQHLWKEDRLLLPMADQMLSTAEQKALHRAFGRLTSEVELGDLAAGIERQLIHPPSHLGEVLI